MKLYYIPGACSFASHITLHELGLPHELVKVDAKTKTFGEGRDFFAVNAKGYVPVLELDDGAVLTENPAILQYLADRKPESGLAPANGTMERYRLQESLGYLSSEVHKAFSPLFNPKITDDGKKSALEKLGKTLDALQTSVGDRQFLLDGRFTVADAYLFVMLGWTGHVGVELARWPKLEAFSQRIAQRPSVSAARKMEQAQK